MGSAHTSTGWALHSEEPSPAGDRAPMLAAVPGRVVGLVGAPGTGLTRVGLSLLTAPARRGPVAVVDVRGWVCPAAAWEMGIASERLVVVRCGDRDRWPQVVATLVEGVAAAYAEVPAGIGEAALRRIGALVRARRRSLLLRPLRGSLPPGLAHLTLEATPPVWEGTGDGHGRLTRRRITLEMRGKDTGGIPRTVEMEDDGADAVRVVSRVGAAPRRLAAG